VLPGLGWLGFHNSSSEPAPHTIPEEMPEPYISPLSTVIHPEKYIEFFCFLFIDVVVSFLKIPR
jgi:hypothetical protein